ncbi:MAG: hypothetical protein AAF744_09470 [Pseudomonadota bacterium]
MGYRDDFYTVENIYGYTGAVSSNPTVYFLEKLDNEVFRFGRITQDHDNELNIGREKVREKADYDIDNKKFSDGKMRCVEYYDRKRQHTSRSEFVFVGDMPDVQATLLNKSITRFTDEKPLSNADIKDKYAAHFGKGAGDAFQVVEEAKGEKPKITFKPRKRGYKAG